MSKMPAYLPEYRIEASSEKLFAVKWEELMGWFLIPKMGEKLSWGMYDLPTRKCSYVYDMEVVGKAKVHGLEGVELTARETSCENPEEVEERRFIAQLTDTHCRYLAALQQEGDVSNYITFLDGEEFLMNWGFGEDICVMDIETYNGGVVSEQYLDQNGRTVLWRRFNRDDWQFDYYKKKWSEQLPENERLTVNGMTYVHWYDCITDQVV